MQAVTCYQAELHTRLSLSFPSSREILDEIFV